MKVLKFTIEDVQGIDTNLYSKVMTKKSTTDSDIDFRVDKFNNFLLVDEGKDLKDRQDYESESSLSTFLDLHIQTILKMSNLKELLKENCFTKFESGEIVMETLVENKK